jgi:hypothetical protein
MRKRVNQFTALRIEAPSGVHQATKFDAAQSVIAPTSSRRFWPADKSPTICIIGAKPISPRNQTSCPVTIKQARRESEPFLLTVKLAFSPSA